jgi:hypothetical protein
VAVPDLDFVGIAVLPANTQPVLIVHPDAVLARAVTPPSLEPIAGCASQLTQVQNAIQLVELPMRRWPNGQRTRHRAPRYLAIG